MTAVSNFIPFFTLSTNGLRMSSKNLAIVGGTVTIAALFALGRYVYGKGQTLPQGPIPLAAPGSPRLQMLEAIRIPLSTASNASGASSLRTSPNSLTPSGTPRPTINLNLTERVMPEARTPMSTASNASGASSLRTSLSSLTPSGTPRSIVSPTESPREEALFFNPTGGEEPEQSQKTVWTHITDFCRAHSKAIAIAFTVIGAALAVFGLTWLTLGLAPLAFSGAALITPLIAGSISTAVGGGLIGGMVPLLKPAQI
ncbi:MAG: hypothetical protein WCN87_04525 [Chlamydiota bacterium]